MRNIISGLSLLGLSLSLGSVALAKGGAHPQNHHCMKDGADLAGKTKKECKKEGGTWEKDAAPATTDKPAADAAKPAPTDSK
jgi:hypothetical protein